MKRGEKFREYREGAGWTQVEMAELLGYSPNSTIISQKETGEKVVTRRDMLAARCVYIDANYEID